MSRFSLLEYKPSRIQSYGIAILSLGAALIFSRWAAYHLEIPPTPFFMCAVMLSAWFGGVGPALVATALSTFVFHYCLLPPIYSLGLKSGEIPKLFGYTSAHLFVGLLSAAQRNAKESLRRTRDELKATVENLLRTNDALLTKSRERDQTENRLQRSQAYLAESQRLSKTGSWALSPHESKAHYWSDEMFRMWNLDPEDGPPDWQVSSKRIHPDDFDSFRRGLEQLLEGQLRVELAGDFRLVMPDGTVKYIHAILHPVFDEAGHVVEYLGTNVDVTERKHAEGERERLRQLEADLEHINRVSMMGELAASLAHELNQPVTAAITNAKTCIRWLSCNQPDLEEAREAATRMAKDGTRATEIINGLRSFYKKGTLAEREVVDVSEVIREMTALLRDEAIRCSVSVNLELAHGIPKVIADRVQLQQVFMNLMLNAMEAMQKKGGELTIKSQLGTDEQPLISVSDTGVGLPLEKPEQIFDAFYTTKPRGTGMGLAITRRIIEAHGGRLWAGANSGRGAIFHFTLPVAAERREKVEATGT